MKEYRIFYSILYIIVLILAVSYQSKFTAVLFIVMTVVPIISMLLLLIGFSVIKIRVECKNKVLEKKESGKFTVLISRSFPIPLPSFRLYGIIQNPSDGQLTDCAIIIENTDRAFDVPMKFPYRGEYRVGCYRYEMFDLLGLFLFRRKIDGMFDVVVIPRNFNLSGINDTSLENADKGMFQINPFHNTVFSSLREYREGDNLRQIHWKLSAKQGELVSKELETPLTNTAVIFADFTKTFLDVETAMSVTDAIIETTLALNKRILEDNNKAENFWQNKGKCESLVVSDINAYTQFLYTLAVIPFEGNGEDFSELAKLFYHKLDDSSIYFITPFVDENFRILFEKLNLTRRKNLYIYTFSKTEKGGEIYDYFQNETPAEIKIFNEDKLFPIS